MKPTRALSPEARIERTIKFGEKCAQVSEKRQKDYPERESLEIEYRRGIWDMLFTLRTEETHYE